MKRNSVITLFLITPVALMLNGCESLVGGRDLKRPVSERFPVEVKSASFKLPIKPEGDSGSLTSVQLSQIKAFVSSYFVRGGGGDVYIAYVESSTQSTLLATAAKEELHRLGIDWDRLSSRSVEGSSQKSIQNIELSFNTYVTETRGCNDERSEFVVNWNHAASANFGCATQSNIAAMIADPHDLKRPTALTPADAERRDMVLDGYRKGEATGQTSDPLISQTAASENQ